MPINHTEYPGLDTQAMAVPFLIIFFLIEWPIASRPETGTQSQR